jgi:hypothetical protein
MSTVKGGKGHRVLDRHHDGVREKGTVAAIILDLATRWR